MTTPFRNLSTFCAVAQHLSFKDAADELFLSASAVSHQIRDLEEYLGVKLFARHTRAIKLTDQGQTLYDDIAPNVDAINQSARAFRREPTRTRLTVKMPEFFTGELFVPRMTEFTSAHQNIDLRLASTGTTSDEQADVRVLLSGREPEYANAEKLFPIRYVPACSEARQEEWSDSGAEVLQQAPLLLHQARPYAWHQWASLAGLKAPSPRQIIRLDSMYGLVRAAERGVGIALIPMPLSRAWFEAGALHPLFPEDLNTTDFYYVVNTARRQNAEAAQKLCQWIIQTFDEYA